MIERKVTVTNPTGLHARPANDFCKLASQFKCSTKIIKGELEADAKSILNIMVAAITCGTEITLRTDGEDETEAMEAMVKFIEELEE